MRDLHAFSGRPKKKSSLRKVWSDMLEVKGLSVHFGGLKAVEKVDLKVVKGEILSAVDRKSVV